MSAPLRQPGATLSTGLIGDQGALAVSPHALASEAAIATMRAGGNAVDAAVALNAVLGVVLPDTCGPGGDLFALIHLPGETAPLALNGSGRSGSNAAAAVLRDLGLASIPIQSHHAITVPGCVDGWEALLGRLGTISLGEALARAISLAAEGFPVSPELASSLGRQWDRIGTQPSAFELYPDGRAPAAGSVIRRPALARTLSDLASGGRSAFFGGPVGAAIVEVARGTITPDDLAVAQADWIDPLGLDLFARTAWTIPPNSQGYLTLAGLWIFEQLDPPSDPRDPAFQHALIEAYRSVAWERPDLVCDAATAPLTPAELVSRERLTGRLAAIGSEAAAWPPSAATPGGTAYMCVRDGSGMAISLIQSNFWGIGSGLSAGDTGVWLHNRGAGFDLRPGHPNELRPGRRPLHTLAPTLWTREGELDLLLGTRGGDQQPQLLMQFAAAHYGAGASIEDAQQMPRWTIALPSTAYSRVEVERRFQQRTIDGLLARGHVITEAEEWMPASGPISAIDAGLGLRGAADPRVTTSAAISG